MPRLPLALLLVGMLAASFEAAACHYQPDPYACYTGAIADSGRETNNFFRNVTKNARGVDPTDPADAAWHRGRAVEDAGNYAQGLLAIAVEVLS